MRTQMSFGKLKIIAETKSSKNYWKIKLKKPLGTHSQSILKQKIGAKRERTNLGCPTSKQQKYQK